MVAFIFGKKIGSGGFGIVRHATRQEDGLPFAVKHLLEEYAEDEELVARFRREVRIQRGLEHPNVLPIIGANLSASPPWFVMPIAERTLADEIASDLDEAEIDRMFAGILAGVAHAHENGVIHRDVKPENVMMTHDVEPQVSDFGLGKNVFSDSATLTKTYLGAGSFPYHAPEQMISLKEADGRADIYALGKVLQAMLTGRLPVLTNDEDVPRKYSYFIAKCTAQKPDDRYQTMTEVMAAFQQVTRGVEEPRPPRDIAADLIEEWRALPGEDDLPKLQELHEFLERHVDDGELFRAIVPALPSGMHNDYIEHLPNEFKRTLEIYDGHVSGSLDFDYCDVVADFYRTVYKAMDDLDVRRLILARLVAMGASHNRYHVGDVVASILTGVTDTSEVMMVVDVLRADPDHAQWFKPNPVLRTTKLAEPIDDVLYAEL